MKKLLVNIFLFSAIFYSNAHSQWVDLNINFNGYYGYFLKNDLKFFDENTGWMAGYESAYPLNIGAVLKSTNGGLNWFQLV